jgi:hypothetical protein
VSPAELAALIAAGFFAAGMCALVFVLLRLAGLISRANRILTDYSGQASALTEQAQSAVRRANEQLVRTDSITASMDEVTANMADLSGHVSALAGLARGISVGLGAPLLRLSAFAFGVRRAVALRRPARVGTAALREPGGLASRQSGAESVPDALPAGRTARLRGARPRQRRGSRREEARR